MPEPLIRVQGGAIFYNRCMNIRFFAITITLALFACSSDKQSASAPAPGKGKAGAAGRTPQVAAVVIHEISERESSLGIGTILAAEQVELKTEMAGRVAQIAFREGATVAKGAVLLRLDDSELQASRNKAQVKRDYQHSQLARKQKLAESGAATALEVETAQLDLASAEADLRLAEAQLLKTVVRAPFAGRLGLRNISPGAYVSTGASVTTLVQDLPARVEFALDGEKAVLATPGTIVLVDDGKGKSWSARIEAREGSLESGTRALKVRARITGDPGLWPGSAVPVRLSGNALSGFLIPPDALSGNAAGPLVYVYRGGKAKAQAVRIGMRTATGVLLTDGVAIGDTVLCAGALNMRDGQAVSVTEIRP